MVIGIAGLTPSGTSVDSIDMRGASEWADTIAREIDERGLRLDMGYPNFTCDIDMDTASFFGEEATRRLKAVKQKYDPENVFFRGYPRLA